MSNDNSYAESTIRSFDATWNANDVDAIMDRFSDNPTVALNPAPPGSPSTFVGRDQVREWVTGLAPGFHVDSQDFRYTDNGIEWRAYVTSDSFRAGGIDTPLGCDCTLVLDGEKGHRFTVNFTPEAVAAMVAAAEQAGASA